MDSCEDLQQNQGIVCGIVSVIGALLFIVCSIGSVPPLQYGIKYNYFNKIADISSVYPPGRTVIFPWNGFLLFPATAQSVEFSSGMNLVSYGVRYPALHTRTKDGLALHLQASLQYKLRKDYVGMLYRNFSVDYENFFISQVRNVLTTVAADYVGTEFWKKRKELGREMEFAVNKTLGQTYADCWGLQILDIELPNEFNSAIVATQVKAQKIATQQFMQQSTQVRAMTGVIEAEYKKKVKVIKVQGRANFTYTTKAAKAEAMQRTIETEATIAEDVKNKLKLGPKEMIDYQQYVALLAANNANLLYGFDSGVGVMLTSGGAAIPVIPPSSEQRNEL